MSSGHNNKLDSCWAALAPLVCLHIWQPRNKKSTHDDLSTYDDELMLDRGILPRPPMTSPRIQPLRPTTFPETLTGGTAEPKATADILWDTLGSKILLNDHPACWDRRFFEDEAIEYFAPVFSHVCLFPHEEREAVMAECTPLFERLEESIRSAADSISRGEMAVGNLTPYRRSNAARARVYLDKLKDLHMTRLDVVRGRYEADSSEDKPSEYPGQWLRSWGHPTAP
ncbi:hypothetical protein V2G26_005386 [Clonostachys chloroleuca]